MTSTVTPESSHSIRQQRFQINDEAQLGQSGDITSQGQQMNYQPSLSRSSQRAQGGFENFDGSFDPHHSQTSITSSPSQQRNGLPLTPSATASRVARVLYQPPVKKQKVDHHRCVFDTFESQGNDVDKKLHTVVKDTFRKIEDIAESYARCPKDVGKTVLNRVSDMLRSIECSINPAESKNPEESRSNQLLSPEDGTASLHSSTEFNMSEQYERAEHDQQSANAKGDSPYSEQEIRAFDNYLRSEMQKPCPHPSSRHRNLERGIPCPRQTCSQQYDKNGWERHIKGFSVDRLWICHLCSNPSIFRREEFFRKHLLGKHFKGCPDHMTEAKKAAKSREPYRVPFFAKCGICRVTSTNWKWFWKEHVLIHLAEDGLAHKGYWDYEFAPVPPDPGPVGSKQSKGKGRAKKHQKPGCTPEFNGNPGGEDEDPNPDPDPQARGFHHSYAWPGAAQQGQVSQQRPSNGQNHQGSQNTGQTYQRFYYCSTVSSNSEKSLLEIGEVILEERRRAGQGRLEYMQAADHPLKPNEGDVKSWFEVSSLRQGMDIQLLVPFRKIKDLSRGSKTLVEEIEYWRTSIRCVRKRVKFLFQGRQLQKRFNQEVGALRRLAHPHTLHLIDWFREHSTYSLILKPAAETTLEKYLRSSRRIQKDKITRWFSCLASAVTHLHSDKVNVCHCNINSTNILLHSDHVVLADFSLSRRSSTSATENGLTCVPQIHTSTMVDEDKAGDVWALGTVYLEMLTTLCESDNGSLDRSVLPMVTTSFRSPEESKSYEVLGQLSALKTKADAFKLSLKDVDFFSSAFEACNRMLQPDQAMRPSAEDVYYMFPHSECCESVHVGALTSLEPLLERLSLQKGKYRALAAGSRSSPVLEKPSSIETQSKLQLLNVGDWAQNLESVGPTEIPMKEEDDDDDSSTLVDLELQSGLGEYFCSECFA